MKKIYKAVIFDLDGVICHTDEYHFKAWKKLADEIGIYFNGEINNRLRGIGRMQSLEILLGNESTRFSNKEKEHMAEVKNNYYRSYLGKMSPGDIDPEVLETLYALRKSGIKTAIGSSSKKCTAHIKTDRTS